MSAAFGSRPRRSRVRRAPRGVESPAWLSLTGGAEIVVLHQRILLQLLHRAAVEHDLAMNHDVAAVGDADRLVEILLRHQDGQSVAALELADHVDGLHYEQGR